MQVPVVVTEQERVSTHHTHRHAEVEVCGQKGFTEVEDRPVVRSVSWSTGQWRSRWAI
jgi:hypothetical protein